MIKEFQNTETDRIILHESGILSINWVNQEKDLEVIVDWGGQEDLKNKVDFDSIRTILYFDFITDIEFNFKCKHYSIGALEISAFKYLKLSDDTYSIDFKFDIQPVGYIKFNPHCN